MLSVIHAFDTFSVKSSTSPSTSVADTVMVCVVPGVTDSAPGEGEYAEKVGALFEVV
jgi:hypothetical protein